jgi:PAS domain S-box-containing protein
MAEKSHVKRQDLSNCQRQNTTNKANVLDSGDVFKAVAENTSTYLAYLDRDFNFVWVNPSYAKGTGYDVERLVGQNHFNLFPNKENQAIFEKVRDTGQPAEFYDKPFEYRYQSRQGDTYWDWTLVPIKDIKGKVQGLVLSLTDITSRKKTELQLERIAREWRTTFDSISDFISIHDMGYKFVRVNRALSNALKMKPGEMIGKPCYELLHKTHRPWPSCPHQRTMETKMPAVEELFEANLRLHLEVTTLPVLDENGQLTQTVHISRDITKRKMAEAALKESERKYRELADMLPLIVFEADRNGRVTFANRMAYRITGYTPDDFDQAMNLAQMVAPEDLNKLKDNMQRIMNREESPGNEYTIVRKDGSTFPARVFSSPVLRDGEVCGLEGIVIDLTDQRRLEQLKDEFIGLVSHELRTPLTTIMGSVNMVLNTWSQLSQKDSRRLLTDAAMASEDLSGILGNLLELSRVKADRLILHLEPVNVKTLTRNVIRQLKPRTSIHRFVVDISKETPPVAADPLRLERILHNLLENAVRYSPNGGEIRISARKEGIEMVIQVHDQGIGISQSDQARLFAPFQRLEEIKTAGIGLGLLVCRRLVESHGGRIWVESEPGRGATFFFTIPL